MAEFGGTELTNGGRNILAKALVGKTIKFTRAYAGEGFLPEGQDISEMTELIAPICEMGISGMDIPPYIGTAKISVVLTNKDLTRGFFLREIGLFAEDPDTHEEVLYSYCNAGNKADYVPGYGGADAIFYQVDFTAVVDQAKDVTAVFVENPLGGYYGPYVLNLPVSGWREASVPSPDYSYVCDIELVDATSYLIPMGGCIPGYFSAADRAGMMSGCESCDGFIRFYSKRKPDEDIEVQIILFRKGGVPPSGDIDAGDGLAFGADGKLAVKIGEGLRFDDERAVAADTQTVLTNNDLLNEDETEQDLKDILVGEDGTADAGAGSDSVSGDGADLDE